MSLQLRLCLKFQNGERASEECTTKVLVKKIKQK